MTDKKTEALKLALEALEMHVPHVYKDRGYSPIIAIREALADQPAPVAEPHEQQEPVAWYGVNIAGVKYLGWKYEELDGRGFDVLPLYKSPQRKPWVGLTDDEIHKMTVLMGINPEWKAEIEIVRSIVRNLEAKLKEKNQ